MEIYEKGSALYLYFKKNNKTVNKTRKTRVYSNL